MSSTDEKAITTILHSYRDALNASSVSAVVPLYAPSAILMAQSFPTTFGTSAIKSAYETIFKAITLKVDFDIKEIVLTGTEYAFARTSSAGTQTINATGETSQEGNQELFVLVKNGETGGEWKIGRYCFCTTNPPK